MIGERPACCVANQHCRAAANWESSARDRCSTCYGCGQTADDNRPLSDALEQVGLSDEQQVGLWKYGNDPDGLLAALERAGLA